MTDATQQPDPFSELRGLMERARYVLELDEKWGNFSAYTNVSRQLFKDMTATLDQVQPLLDERDRLHEGLRERGMRIFDIDPVTDALDALTEWKGYSDKFEARALSAEGEVEKLKAALEAVKALAVPVKTPTPNLLVGLLSRIHMLARQALSQEIG